MIDLHISVRKSKSFSFLMDLCEVACCRKKNIPKIDFTVNKKKCEIEQVYTYSIPGVFAQSAKHPLLDYLSIL